MRFNVPLDTEIGLFGDALFSGRDDLLATTERDLSTEKYISGGAGGVVVVVVSAWERCPVLISGEDLRPRACVCDNTEAKRDGRGVDRRDDGGGMAKR